MDQPDVIEKVRESAQFLARKWGSHNVVVLVSPTDYMEISQWTREKGGGDPGPGPQFKMTFERTEALSKGDFIAVIDRDGDDHDLIEV